MRPSHHYQPADYSPPVTAPPVSSLRVGSDEMDAVYYEEPNVTGVENLCHVSTLVGDHETERDRWELHLAF